MFNMNKELISQHLRNLICEKEKLEEQIDVCKVTLQQNGVGMTDSLVDNEDFPRNDIDVYQVRHARHEINKLLTEYHSLMNQIEEGLHALHAYDDPSASSSSTSTVPVEPAERFTEPVARISEVTSNSPADLAGLRMDDLIVEFGSVNNVSFKSLQDIATIVQHSVGQAIILRVRRKDMILHLSLTPKQWQGRGLLGCNIMPYESVER